MSPRFIVYVIQITTVDLAECFLTLHHINKPPTLLVFTGEIRARSIWDSNVRSLRYCRLHTHEERQQATQDDWRKQNSRQRYSCFHSEYLSLPQLS